MGEEPQVLKRDVADQHVQAISNEASREWQEEFLRGRVLSAEPLSRPGRDEVGDKEVLGANCQ